MATKPKINLDELIPDNFLLAPKAKAEAAPVASAAAPAEVKVKFSNQLPLETWRQLQQLSYWSRKDLSVLLDQALTAFFKEHPDAQRELPEDEKKKRKLL